MAGTPIPAPAFSFPFPFVLPVSTPPRCVFVPFVPFAIRKRLFSTAFSSWETRHATYAFVGRSFVVVAVHGKTHDDRSRPRCRLPVTKPTSLPFPCGVADDLLDLGSLPRLC